MRPALSWLHVGGGRGGVCGAALAEGGRRLLGEDPLGDSSDDFALDAVGAVIGEGLARVAAAVAAGARRAARTAG